jgi:acyl carrier protein
MNNTTLSFDDVQDVLVNAVAAEAAIPPIDLATDQPFTSLGLDSIAALSVGAEIGESLGLSDLPVSLLWDYPTVDDLAGVLWQLINTQPEPLVAENE